MDIFEPTHLLILFLLLVGVMLAFANIVKTAVNSSPHSHGPNEKFCSECGRIINRTEARCHLCGYDNGYSNNAPVTPRHATLETAYLRRMKAMSN